MSNSSTNDNSANQETNNCNWKVRTNRVDRSVFELYRQYQKGNLDLQPPFQRLAVWDERQSSKLIESALLEVPIPVVYLSEEQDSSYAVIDGQQRLSAFCRFIENKYRLRALVVRSDLNGKLFKELSSQEQDKLERCSIRVIEIRKDSEPNLKFEIFERLNTGSVHLNAQELRTCIYRGTYNQLLRNLSDDTDYQDLLGFPITKRPHPRMLDRELALRFFAFKRQSHLNYKPPMKRFLNQEMSLYQELGQDDAAKLRASFRKAINLAKTVFGSKSFRRFMPGSEVDPNGYWEATKINKAVFDVVMYGFMTYEPSQIVPNSDSIREELIHLMASENNFIDAIATYTDNTAKVQLRFEMWLASLREIVGYPQHEPRTFTINFKKQLWETDRACRICDQELQSLDDCEVDHIVHYWRGGKTIPNNARLTHRHCNRARPKTDPAARNIAATSAARIQALSTSSQPQAGYAKRETASGISTTAIHDSFQPAPSSSFITATHSRPRGRFTLANMHIHMPDRPPARVTFPDQQTSPVGNWGDLITVVATHLVGRGLITGEVRNSSGRKLLISNSRSTNYGNWRPVGNGLVVDVKYNRTYCVKQAVYLLGIAKIAANQVIVDV